MLHTSQFTVYGTEVKETFCFVNISTPDCSVYVEGNNGASEIKCLTCVLRFLCRNKNRGLQIK